jgi:hypothetical protein
MQMAGAISVSKKTKGLRSKTKYGSAGKDGQMQGLQNIVHGIDLMQAQDRKLFAI